MLALVRHILPSLLLSRMKEGSGFGGSLRVLACCAIAVSVRRRCLRCICGGSHPLMPHREFSRDYSRETPLDPDVADSHISIASLSRLGMPLEC